MGAKLIGFIAFCILILAIVGLGWKTVFTGMCTGVGKVSDIILNSSQAGTNNQHLCLNILRLTDKGTQVLDNATSTALNNTHI